MSDSSTSCVRSTYVMCQIGILLWCTFWDCLEVWPSPRSPTNRMAPFVSDLVTCSNYLPPFRPLQADFVQTKHIYPFKFSYYFKNYVSHTYSNKNVVMMLPNSHFSLLQSKILCISLKMDSLPVWKKLSSDPKKMLRSGLFFDKKLPNLYRDMQHEKLTRVIFL